MILDNKQNAGILIFEEELIYPSKMNSICYEDVISPGEILISIQFVNSIEIKIR